MTQTNSLAEYEESLLVATKLANRIQIDMMDGQFAPHRNVPPSEVWWPESVDADIHLMYLYPEEAVEQLIALKPHMIIVHTEAQGDVLVALERIQEAGILAGIALLKETKVRDYEGLIAVTDHVLLFAGALGEHADADLSVIEKIPQVRAAHMAASATRSAGIEIGWDGGANRHNVALLAGAGIDVINVGGALSGASDPRHEFSRIASLVG
jgi:ribulose-phosphate 3-epimerase